MECKALGMKALGMKALGKKAMEKHAMANRGPELAATQALGSSSRKPSRRRDKLPQTSSHNLAMLGSAIL